MPWALLRPCNEDIVWHRLRKWRKEGRGESEGMHQWLPTLNKVRDSCLVWGLQLRKVSLHGWSGAGELELNSQGNQNPVFFFPWSHCFDDYPDHMRCLSRYNLHTFCIGNNPITRASAFLQKFSLLAQREPHCAPGGSRSAVCSVSEAGGRWMQLALVRLLSHSHSHPWKTKGWII